MRVLITGAAGFIGSHLADRFTADGHVVVGVDNLLTGRVENVGAWETLEEDIINRPALYRYANKFRPDLVVHCAASYSDPNLWHRDVDTNVAGCINAAAVAKHHGARLVYFQTALPPISSYAISKIAGEQYIRLSGVPALVFRLANIYGPRNISGPIPTFYKRLSAGEPCTVVDTQRDTVYVADLVDLVTRTVASSTVGKFDVCSGSHYPIRRYYNAVLDAMDVPRPLVLDERPRADDDVAQMELDPEPAAETFGWRARTRLEDGIARAVEWYEANGVTATHTHLKLAV